MTPPVSPRRNPGRSRPDRLDRNDERGRLRLHFIALYVGDDEFTDGLHELARSGGDVAAFCRKWGLTFNDYDAAEAIREWCEQYRRDVNISPCALLTYFTWGGFKPIYRGQICFEFFWDPTEESRDRAEARLRDAFGKKLGAALDGVADAYRGYGEPSRQRRPARGKHLNWMFERQRYGRSYGEITRSYPMVEPDAVRQACRRLADEMGLELRKYKIVKT